ncbi:Extracellular serine protease precursor [Methyloligella halotolerans]|uniref:Extracellular serine protease n=1 Tax=Methyloligella halotolerans TaxID=1177755 RepID=A0A1E2RVQ2_9HYPH|nr:autotransporter domain-containing protein [Methyloligella halotolerans]ODA66291.1 Extracellular serine protease precursor [Methyloligella halotolerans]
MTISVKRQILLSTTMLAGAMTGYSGRAYAACTNSGGSTYLCSGSETTTQSINAANPTVTTASDMNFDTTGGIGNALTITGTGDISYTDGYASTSLRSLERGLSVSNNTVGAGSTAISTAGAIYGRNAGIVAWNNNGVAGDLSLTTNGAVSSGGDGITMTGGTLTGDLTVTNNAAVSSDGYGMYLAHTGNGALTVNVNGDVKGTVRDGMDINLYNGTTTITSSAGTTITGGNDGIDLDHNGTGEVVVSAYGNVKGAQAAIDISNMGPAETRITIGGDISGSSGAGLEIAGARNYATVLAGGSATGSFGIRSSSFGSANDITVAGRVEGTANFAIVLPNSTSGNRVELQTGFEVVGIVDSGAGTNDSLEFGGSGSDSFSLSDIGPKYQNFEDFNVIGGKWSFSGTTSKTFSVTGGTLGGTGTFGGLNVGNGGTIAPGNSIGTLNVGNITFAQGSTYQVEVDNSGNSDLINASGTATINGGTVSVLAQSGTYATGTQYTILTAAGGVTGQFSTVTANFAFLDPTLSYDANNVYLLFGQAASFVSAARTPNQRAVAGALDALPTDNEIFVQVLNQTEDGARQAFDALSGEIHASVGGALLDEGRHIRDAVMGRMVQASYDGTGLGSGGPQNTQASPSGMMMLGYGSKDLGSYEPLPTKKGPVFWTQGFGSWANFDGNGNAASLDRDMGGFISGVDAEVMPGWRAGIAAGYSYTGLDKESRLSSADVDAYHLVLYGSGKVNRFDVRGGGAYSWQDIETSRNIVFPGFSEFEQASYDGDRGQLFGEIAYPVVLHPSIAMEGFSGLAYVHQETDGFTESGGLAAFNSSGYNEDVTYSTTGFRAATTMAFGNAVITPNLSVAWLHAFDSVDTDLALAFAAAGPSFDIQGTPIARDSALVQAGLDFAVSPNATLSVAYDGQFASDADEHGIKGRASWKF